MKKQFFIFSFVILLSTACNSTKDATNNSIKSEFSTSESMVNAVVWQQTSAEYEALCYQAYNIARKELQSNVAGGADYTGYPAAVIMDLDETVLDNTPYEAQLILENKNYSKASWDNWVNSMKAELVPGAKEFIEFATNMGLHIIFISNREQNLLEPTMQNLMELGININRENYYLKIKTSNKSDRRQNVESEFQIVMLIGDNLTDDFSEEFNEVQNITQREQFTNANKEKFGHKYIILPNPMYGGWQNALKAEDADEKKVDPKKFLKGY